MLPSRFSAMVFVFVCWQEVATWRTFAIGAPTAREVQIDRFFVVAKKGVLYTNCLWKSKNMDKNSQNPFKKLPVSSPSNHLAEFVLKCCATFENNLEMFCNIWGQTCIFTKPRLMCCATSRAWPDLLYNMPVFPPVLCALSTCVHIILIFWRKKLDLASFFWQQGPPIQKSVAQQGLPPPTQQINIRNTNKLSWAINYAAWWHFVISHSILYPAWSKHIDQISPQKSRWSSVQKRFEKSAKQLNLVTAQCLLWWVSFQFGAEYCIHTLPRGGMYWVVHPRRPRDFPRPERHL